jgi:ABC-type multidrug transport system ATPase subunit
MRFEDAWLRYARRAPWVLTEVDVSLGPGEIAVVLGRNGAGKTTLLAAAAGLLVPDRGRVLERPARVGWVPERFPATQPFTVRSYLVNMARVRGLAHAVAVREVEAWAQRLALERYLEIRLAEVSKGTAQKVGLIQALVPEPDLLVLDEPWEGLDAQTREEVPQIIAGVVAAGGSVLVSDHLGEVARLPGAYEWHVEAGRVSVSGGRDAIPVQPWVIEVGVAAPQVDAAVAWLRAAGHEVLGVRQRRAHERQGHPS